MIKTISGEEYTKAVKAVGLPNGRTHKNIYSLEMRIDIARAWREMGFSIKQIADLMNTSYPTIQKHLKFTAAELRKKWRKSKKKKR